MVESVAMLKSGMTDVAVAQAATRAMMVDRNNMVTVTFVSV